LPAAVVGLALGYALQRRRVRRGKTEPTSDRQYLIICAVVLGFIALFDALISFR
jgi:uncharacterized membrane protein SpoIIM required for sporulation